MEIQDSYYQVFRPTPQEIEYTKTSVYNDDIYSRQYIDFQAFLSGGEAPQIDKLKDPMLKVNIKLDTNTIKQERTAYDTLVLFGDIGGLLDFFIIVVSPLMALIVGSRFNFSLLSYLYWVNDTDPNENNRGTTQEKVKKWMDKTKRFQMTRSEVAWQNPIVRCITCRRYA